MSNSIKNYNKLIRKMNIDVCFTYTLLLIIGATLGYFINKITGFILGLIIMYFLSYVITFRTQKEIIKMKRELNDSQNIEEIKKQLENIEKS